MQNYNKFAREKSWSLSNNNNTIRLDELKTVLPSQLIISDFGLVLYLLSHSTIPV